MTVIRRSSLERAMHPFLPQVSDKLHAMDAAYRVNISWRERERNLAMEV